MGFGFALTLRLLVLFCIHFVFFVLFLAKLLQLLFKSRRTFLCDKRMLRHLTTTHLPLHQLRKRSVGPGTEFLV